MKKLETIFTLTIRVLVYACAIACGVMFGVGFADCVTAAEFSNTALVLPMQIAVGVFAGTCATGMALAFLDGLLDP